MPGKRGQKGVTNVHAATGVVPLALMWMGMMAVMMAPAVWPWVRVFAGLCAEADSRLARVTATAAFVGGYLAAWALYSIAAALLQKGAESAGLLDPVRGLTPAVGAGVLIGAGAYQFAPLKRACLTHCRSPFGYFVTRWRNGPIGGFGIGLGHGFFCVGCCWALMATVFAVGVMNAWWMAALAATAFAEQVVPRGDLVRAPLGVALIVMGVLRI
jgi:predicted metal-binding membrane protein